MSRDNYQRKEARRREHDRRRWTCKNPAGCTFVFNPAAVEAGIVATEGGVDAETARRLVKLADLKAAIGVK